MADGVEVRGGVGRSRGRLGGVGVGFKHSTLRLKGTEVGGRIGMYTVVPLFVHPLDKTRHFSRRSSLKFRSFYAENDNLGPIQIHHLHCHGLYHTVIAVANI